MTARLDIQLPTDGELRRAPQRSQLVTLRVALVLTERALLRQHDAIRWSTVPTLAESRPQSMARLLVNRMRELHALADAYDQLLVCAPPPSDEDDEIDF